MYLDTNTSLPAYFETKCFYWPDRFGDSWVLGHCFEDLGYTLNTLEQLPDGKWNMWVSNLIKGGNPFKIAFLPCPDQWWHCAMKKS